MGQAKARGTKEQRVQEAIAAGRIKKPSMYNTHNGFVNTSGISTIARSSKLGGVLAAAMLATAATQTEQV